MDFFFLALYVISVYLRPSTWIQLLEKIQLMDIFAILAVVFSFMRGVGVKRKKSVNPVNVFMILLFTSVVCSQIARTYLGGAFVAFSEFFKIIVLYFLIIRIVNTDKRLKIMLILILGSIVVLALQGIYQFKTGMGLAGQSMYQGRITWIGIFNDPNDLCLGFVIAIPLALSFLFSEKPLLNKVIYLVSAIILIIGIFLTNSRGGILAFFVSTLIYISLVFPRQNKVLKIFIGVVIFILFVLLSPTRMSQLSADDSSSYGRIEAWYAGINMLKSAPIFGVGYGRFMDYHFRTAHNSVVLIAAEIGFLGLYCWIGLFYLSLRNLYLLNYSSVKKFAQVKKQNRLFVCALFSGIAGFLASAFFLSRAYISLPYMLVALSVAMINISQDKGESSGVIFSTMEFNKIFLITVIFLMLTYLAVKVYI